MSSQPTLSITLVESRNPGVPTAVCRRVDGREFFLHSQWDPLEEARFLVRDIASRERTLYVVLGYGMGYHIKALLQRIPQSSHILVVEPQIACLSSGFIGQMDSASTAWIQNDRLKFLALHDAQAAAILLADHLARRRLHALEVYTHLPSALTAEAFYHELLEAVSKQFLTSLRGHLKQVEELLSKDLCNFWANLRPSWNAVAASSLAGKWMERALIIVSAGPSLNAALPFLNQANAKAFLLATAPAVRILMAHQIRPDLVISVDPNAANLVHFKDWSEVGIPLVYYHRIYRGILPLHGGPKFYFVMQDEPPIPLSQSAQKSGYLQGGSVAFSALQLAHSMQANPVIFVGQDFAFAGGHTHASGSNTDQTYDMYAPPPDYFTVPGVDGRPVVTNRLYYSYLLYMQDYLFKYAKAHPGVEHINTSLIGARMDGMQYLGLEDILASQRVFSAPSARDILEDAISKASPPSPEAQKGTLLRWAAELDSLIGRFNKSEDFGRFYGYFKRSSLYAQAARSYDDVYYLYEAETRSDTAAERSALSSAFQEHLRFVLEEVRRVFAAC